MRGWVEWGWDVGCLFSGIGIWPRYIEPSLLRTTRLVLPISGLPSQLNGLTILHVSDLHWSARFSSRLKKKVISQVRALQPDLIAFTGDFLCRSLLEDGEGLRLILHAWKARMGCFAVLGNHDYAKFVTLNDRGEYDVEEPSNASNVSRGFSRLFHRAPLARRVTLAARRVGYHEGLIQLLGEAGVQLLNNKTECIVYRGCRVNICGVEEYTLGKFDPGKAFGSYRAAHLGIVLAHNPDTWASLRHYPGDLLLSGHTHGGQLNVPGLWKRFTRLENGEFKRGLKRIEEKWAYINRGLGSVMNLRLFATPELTLITLQRL